MKVYYFSGQNRNKIFLAVFWFPKEILAQIIFRNMCTQKEIVLMFSYTLSFGLCSCLWFARGWQSMSIGGSSRHMNCLSLSSDLKGGGGKSPLSTLGCPFLINFCYQLPSSSKSSQQQWQSSLSFRKIWSGSSSDSGLIPSGLLFAQSGGARHTRFLPSTVHR